MIIPAAVFRILGFLDKSGKVHQTIQEGCLVLALADTGNPVILRFTSNKKNFTKEDFASFLLEKENSLITKKEYDKTLLKLEEDPDFDLEIEDAVEKFKSENPDLERKKLLEFKKEYKINKASKILRDRKKIGRDTVIRVVISISDKKEKMKIGGEELHIIESRSIIFDKDGNPSKSGFYIYSQQEKSLPVILKPVTNKEGQIYPIASVTLSPLASLSHFEFLVGHIKRTIAMKKYFLSRVDYDYDYLKNNQHLMGLVKKINNFAKIKNVSEKEVSEYLSTLDELSVEIRKNPKLLTKVRLHLGLVINKSDFESIKNEKSPLTQFPEAAVNLNLSTMNPDVKEEAKRYLQSVLTEIFDFSRKFEISSIYYVMSDDSWGYMTNNIQQKQMVFGSRQSFKSLASMELISQATKA